MNEKKSSPEVTQNKPDEKNNGLKPTIVVFGGNGYVGQRVCEIGVKSNYNVISISRKGKPENDKFDNQGAWTNKVQWLQGDALDPKTYEKHFF